MGWSTVAEVAFPDQMLADRAHFGHLKDGFQVFNPEPRLRRRHARELTRQGLARFAEIGDRRFFMWLHYIDPHEPHRKHPEFDFGDRPEDCYASEVAVVDGEIGRLLRHLDESGLESRTVVIVLSDHGTAFGEHFSQGHGSTLYDEQLRVPLIIHVPGVPHSVLDGLVALTDLLPTLLHLVHIEDPHERNGISLWPLALGLGRWENIAYSELDPLSLGSASGQEMLVYGRPSQWVS